MWTTINSYKPTSVPPEVLVSVGQVDSSALRRPRTYEDERRAGSAGLAGIGQRCASLVPSGSPGQTNHMNKRVISWNHMNNLEKYE